MKQVRNENCGFSVNLCRFFNERRNAMKRVSVLLLVLGIMALPSVSAATLIHREGENPDAEQNLGTHKDLTVGGRECVGVNSNYGTIHAAYYHIDGSSVTKTGAYYMTLEMFATNENTPRALYVRIRPGSMEDDGNWDSQATAYTAYPPTSGNPDGGGWVNVYARDAWGYEAGNIVQWDLTAGQNYTIRIEKPSSGTQGGYVDFFDLTLVPEPATIGLMLLGLVGLIRRKK